MSFISIVWLQLHGLRHWPLKIIVEITAKGKKNTPKTVQYACAL